MKQVVVITGGASGLGWAMAESWLAHGATVVIADLDQSLLSRRVEDNRERTLHGLMCDVTDPHDRTTLLDFCVNEFGRLDVLVNNAGITHRSPAPQTNVSVFRKVMEVDWHAPVALTAEATPLLIKSRGLVINIGSMAGWMPVPGRAAYCAAKSALAQYFEVWRLEMARHDVRVLMVYPSFLNTPIEKNALGATGERAVHARSTVGNIRSAEWMADVIMRAVQRGDPWVFPDRLASFASRLWRIAPRLYQRIIRRRFASELDA